MTQETIEDRVALFDLDGTLADYDRAMQREMKKLLSPGEREFVEWDDVPEYVEQRRTLVKSQPGFWRTLPRLELGFHVLNAALKIGFETHVLTKGPRVPSAAWSEKFEWCQEHLPPEVEVTVGRKKSLVYGRVLVDDYPPYFLEWLRVRPRGLVVAVAQSWNKDVDHPNVVRYDGTNVTQVMEALQRAYDREPGRT